jgi:hypothetical protein
MYVHSTRFGLLFSKMGWATIWAISSQTHLVTEIILMLFVPFQIKVHIGAFPKESNAPSYVKFMHMYNCDVSFSFIGSLKAGHVTSNVMMLVCFEQLSVRVGSRVTRFGEFSPIGQLLTFGRDLKIPKAKIFELFLLPRHK